MFLYTEPVPKDDAEPTENDVRLASVRGRSLDRLVKETTLLLRPDFGNRFGQKHRIKDGVRPMRLGYVGQKLVANFGPLTHKSLSAMVNNSKAKLWDLVQAREGTQSGWFEADTALASFELFVQHDSVEERAYNAQGAPRHS